MLRCLAGEPLPGGELTWKACGCCYFQSRSRVRLKSSRQSLGQHSPGAEPSLLPVDWTRGGCGGTHCATGASLWTPPALHTAVLVLGCSASRGRHSCAQEGARWGLGQELPESCLKEPDICREPVYSSGKPRDTQFGAHRAESMVVMGVCVEKWRGRAGR